MASRKRGLPPLFLVTVALVALALILPNSLRIPQSNPSPVLEFAPVPPQDSNTSNTGNVSSLALGSSSSLLEGVRPPPPPDPSGLARTPIDKHCVGDPPRQDEDPMSPPCVRFFRGDNGGETWQGVTRQEIRVVAYVEGGNTQYNGENAYAQGTWIDIDRPALANCPKQQTNPGPEVCDHQVVRQTRALSLYFNARYETYNRHVHFWVYYGQAGDDAGRRKDAAVIYDKIHPFAVLDEAFWLGHNEAFEDAIAARKVLVFTSQTTLRQAFYTTYPKYVWGFWPDVEHWADMYVTYICTKVAPYPVAHMGNPPGSDVAHRGKPRKYAIFYTTDPGEPGLKRFREIVVPRIEKCGVKISAEGSFPINRFTTDVSQQGTEQSRAATQFKSQDITTVLYLGGVENFWSADAEAINYYPEVIIAGDLNQDNNITGRAQSQGVWGNAWAIHFQVRFNNIGSTPGMRAYRASYPGAPDDESRWINELYRDHFMLFQAIQIAGPRLTPDKVDDGFHAIPEKRSSPSPYIASCYFDRADYSCVKDATEIWWDASGISPGDGQPGCWREVRGGKRYLPWQWPPGESVFINGKNDPCTGFDFKKRQRI